MTDWPSELSEVRYETRSTERILRKARPVTIRTHWYTVFLTIVIAVAFSGCRIYMDHPAQPLETTSVARQVIAETLDQQPGSHAAMEIEVTDEKLRMLRSRSNALLATSGTYGTTVYYNSISNMRLSKKGSWFAVTIVGSNNRALLHVYAADRASAERFIDALETMRRAAGKYRTIAD